MCRVLLPSEPRIGSTRIVLLLPLLEGAQPRGGWYLSAIARLQGFSSGSPAAFPHQWAIWWREASRAAASAPPSALRIFVIVAGAEGAAEPELYLPHGPAGHLLLQHSWERALTGLAEGADFDNAWPSGRKRRQLQHAWFASSAGSGTASGATSHRWAECGYLPTVRAAVAPRTPGDRPRRRALLWRRSCSWAVLPLLRHNAFTGGSVLARSGGLEWGSAGGQVAGEVLVADEIAAAICALGLRLFSFDSLSSPLEWRRGRGPCRSCVCPEVIAAAVWPPGAEVVVAGTEPESHL
jgi:hypothetical protein